MNKLIINTLVAGCLAIGASFAAESDSTSAAEKAKYEALKEEFSKKRLDFQASHDSLKVEHKVDIEKFKEAAKVERDKWRAGRDSVKCEIKNLVEESKKKLGEAKTDGDKAKLRKDLDSAVCAVHKKLEKDQKKDLDIDKKKTAEEIAAHRAEWEKMLAEHKASHDSLMVKIEDFKNTYPSHDSTFAH